MKQLSFLAVLIVLFKFSFAQELTVLPKDETGKYTYYEVVNTIAREDSLKTSLLNFFTKNKKEIRLKSAKDAKVILASGKLIVQKSKAMLSHPSAEITYVFNFEVAEGKYRFWLSNFEFIPYQKDRYGNFIPSTTVGIPLENEPKKSNTEQWEDYRLQTTKYAINFAKRLKDYLEDKKAIPPPTPEKKVISKNW